MIDVPATVVPRGVNCAFKKRCDVPEGHRPKYPKVKHVDK